MYKEYTPHPLLAPYIKCFWSFNSTEGEQIKKRILPDTAVEMFFHLENLCTRYDSSGNVTHSNYKHGIMGVNKSTIFLSPHGNISMIGVRFLETGATDLLKISAHELTGMLLDIKDVFTHKDFSFLETIYELTDIDSQLSILNNFFIRLIDKDTAPQSHIIKHLTGIYKKGHPGDLPTYSKQNGISVRHLERLFKQKVGISPKSFERICRMNQVISVLKNTDIPLTEIAYKHSYFDQAHFINDFKNLTGSTPKVLRSELNCFSPFYTRAY